MENRTKNEKMTRILYLAVVGVLIVSAVIIGLVAALSRDDTKLPEPTPPVEEDPTPDNGKTEAPVPNETVSTYLAPVTGVLSKSHDDSLPVYSTTMNDFRVHQGIDVATKTGADVLATAKGTVFQIWTDPLMGECLSIDHGNGVVSIYKNLSREMAEGIAEGTAVVAGQKLGTVGESALIESAEEPHLHFEMTYKGESVDPLTYIDEESRETSFSSDTAYES